MASQRANSNFFAAAGTKTSKKTIQKNLAFPQKGKVFYCVILFAILNAHTQNQSVFEQWSLLQSVFTFDSFCLFIRKEEFNHFEKFCRLMLQHYWKLFYFIFFFISFRFHGWGLMMDIPYLLEMKNTSMIKDLSLFPEGIILCRKVLVLNQSGKRDFS